MLDLFFLLTAFTLLHSDTRKGKLSGKACLKHGKSSRKDGTKITSYKIKIHVEPGFGNPGAFVIENNYKHRFFLQSTTLLTPENKAIHFDCRSWVYPIKETKTSRVFFSNTVSYIQIWSDFFLVLVHFEIGFYFVIAVLSSKPNPSLSSRIEKGRTSNLERGWNWGKERMGSNI